MTINYLNFLLLTCFLTVGLSCKNQETTSGESTALKDTSTEGRSVPKTITAEELKKVILNKENIEELAEELRSAITKHLESEGKNPKSFNLTSATGIQPEILRQYFRLIESPEKGDFHGIVEWLNAHLGSGSFIAYIYVKNVGNKAMGTKYEFSVRSVVDSSKEPAGEFQRTRIKNDLLPPF